MKYVSREPHVKIFVGGCNRSGPKTSEMDCANDGRMNGWILATSVGRGLVVAPAWDDQETMTTSCAPGLFLPATFCAEEETKEREGKVHNVTIWRGGGGCAIVHPRTQSQS